jgi:hypothetical protein
MSSTYKTPRPRSILDYTERQSGLGIKLFPVQRLILKLYYGIELDDRKKSIPILNPLVGKVRFKLTELGYLQYLFESGRCNIHEQNSRPRRELVLSLGRRTGKTSLLSIISNYELYRLLSLGDPQAYYQLPSSQQIQISCVGVDKDQAHLMLRDWQAYLQKVPSFAPFIQYHSLSRIQLWTPADKLCGRARGSLRVAFKSSLSAEGIACTNAALALDDLALFRDERRAYDALAPTTKHLIPKRRKTSEARIVCASSPRYRKGKFYELFHRGMVDKYKTSLVIQAPTWEVNPAIPSEFYQERYRESPRLFYQEFGAQFLPPE